MVWEQSLCLPMQPSCPASCRQSSGPARNHKGFQAFQLDTTTPGNFQLYRVVS